MATTIDSIAWVRAEDDVGPNPRVLKTTKELGVRFLRLQFTDIVGVNKNVEVPTQAVRERRSTGRLLFDGSSIDGFVRIEESDMILVPDLDTLSESSRLPRVQRRTAASPTWSLV